MDHIVWNAVLVVGKSICRNRHTACFHGCVPVVVLDCFFRFHHKRTRAKIDYICLPRNKRVVEYLVYTPMLLMAVVNVVILIRENCVINTTVQILSVNAIALFDFGVMCLITIGCVIGEEVMFRNVLPLLLMKHFNAKMKTAAVVSSLVFAGMHVFNIFRG